MAIHNTAVHSKNFINSSHKWHLSRRCLQSPCIYPPRLSSMATSGEINSTAPISYSLPLQCQCPQVAAAPSSRTTTGRRCSMLCCTIFGPGLHYSQSLLCNLIIHSTSLANPPSEPYPNRNSPTPGVNMPRTRHRMWSRRGGNKGGSTRPPPYLASETTSSSAHQTTGRYPNTHSGRGRS